MVRSRECGHCLEHGAGTTGLTTAALCPGGTALGVVVEAGQHLCCGRPLRLAHGLLPHAPRWGTRGEKETCEGCHRGTNQSKAVQGDLRRSRHYASKRAIPFLNASMQCT